MGIHLILGPASSGCERNCNLWHLCVWLIPNLEIITVCHVEDNRHAQFQGFFVVSRSRSLKATCIDRERVSVLVTESFQLIMTWQREKPGADISDVVFFCLAGEQRHTICLYPYCWQQQPPAPSCDRRLFILLPLFTHASRSSLSFLICFNLSDCYSAVALRGKSESGCNLSSSHINVRAEAYIQDILANNAQGELMFLCDEM